MKNIVQNIFMLIYYYNVRLPYKIRKIVENIIGHKRKKL